MEIGLPLAAQLERLVRREVGGSEGGVPARVRRVAVILPIPYRGGSLRGFKTVAKMLRMGSRLAGSETEVVAAIPAGGSYDIRLDFDDLREMGISLRPFEWQVMGRKSLERAWSFVSDAPLPHDDAEWMVPDDGINHLLDCDFWLFVSDRASRPIAPLRPAGHLIYDYIQQIRPDIFPRDFDDSAFLVNAQRAKFVLCTTPFTAEGAVNYAGVDPHRVHLIDMEIEVDLDEAALGGRAPRLDRPYVLWPTNASPHKNHLAALDALDLYLRKHDGGFDIVCTGFNTSWFDLRAQPLPAHDDPQIRPVRDRIASSPALMRHLHQPGLLEERDYFATLSGARFVFHPALVDNGTFAVTEAAWFHVPSLVHDYPAMRWMDERFGLAMAFCDARDPEATALALRRMEDEADARRGRLPARDALRRHGWRSLAPDFWRKVGRLMENPA